MTEFRRSAKKICEGGVFILAVGARLCAVEKAFLIAVCIAWQSFVESGVQAPDAFPPPFCKKRSACSERDIIIQGGQGWVAENISSRNQGFSIFIGDVSAIVPNNTLLFCI